MSVCQKGLRLHFYITSSWTRLASGKNWLHFSFFVRSIEASHRQHCQCLLQFHNVKQLWTKKNICVLKKERSTFVEREEKKRIGSCSVVGEDQWAYYTLCSGAMQQQRFPFFFHFFFPSSIALWIEDAKVRQTISWFHIPDASISLPVFFFSLHMCVIYYTTGYEVNS